VAKALAISICACSYRKRDFTSAILNHVFRSMVNSAPTIGLFPSWRYSTRRAARVSSDRDLILLEHQDR
jgi:hypothetical protein